MEILWLSTGEKYGVYFSQDLASRYSIKENMTIQFGKWERKVTVEVNDDLPQNTIAISELIMMPYAVPTNIPYEIAIDEDKIRLGPVIGIVISYKRFFKEEHIGRMMDYEHIKGVLFICRPEDVNLEEKTIKGHYYNPGGETIETQWVEGIFPFPDVMYNRRKKLSQRLLNEFHRHHVNVFNSHYLNKWQQFEIFSENPKLTPFLPETRRITKTSLIEMLEKYNEIYVKPTTRANGEGIRLIRKEGAGYRLLETNSTSQYFYTIPALYKAIKRKNNVLQQSVAFKTENRNVDFRVMLQKDVTKQWCYTGFACKVSIENSFITNKKNRKLIMPGLEALRSMYNLNAEEAKLKENEMAELCESLAREIEERGIHLGDVAFDIIVDSNLELWVLEIQIRYGAFRKIDVNAESYHKFMVTPIYYAKALAGF